MIIDRFEGGFAVVESDGKFYNLPKELLPENAKEGSVIIIKVGEEETEKRREKIKETMNSLFID